MIRICDETILRSAKICHYAYYPAHIAKSYPHLQHVRRIENKQTETSLDVWKSGERSKFISFRGSASIKNILTYTHNPYEPFHFCDNSFNIHKGVYEMFESVHDDILTEVPIDKSTLTFVGYSLGGALAMYCATYFAMMLPCSTTQCHTFGAPMVGDTNFITTFESLVPHAVHVVNQYDIVPYLLQRPFPWLSGYKRVSVDNVMLMKSKQPVKSLLRPLWSHDVLCYIDNIEHHLQKQRLE